MAMAPGYRDLRPSMQNLIGLNNLADSHVGEEIELDLDQMVQRQNADNMQTQIMVAIDKALCSEADGADPHNKICYCYKDDFDREEKPHCKRHLGKKKNATKQNRHKQQNVMQKLKKQMQKHPEANDELKFFELGLPQIDQALEVVLHPKKAKSKEELEADKLIVEHASNTMLQKWLPKWLNYFGMKMPEV